MDVEVSDPFTANNVSMYQGLIDPIFVVNNTSYTEMQLYQFVASHDTAESSCLLLSMIEYLSARRRETAEQYPDIADALNARTYAAYVWYDQYSRRITDDIDIVGEFANMVIH